jgi:hypothetical protein
MIYFYFWCFNATFINISAISCRPVLVVEEAGVPGGYLAFLFVSTIFSENLVVHLFLFVFTVVFLFVYLRSRCVLFVYLRPRLYIVSNVACGSRWPNC